jgi:hypothetical protein
MPLTIDKGFRDFLGKLTPGGAESDGVKSPSSHYPMLTGN